jgi:crotonobetainyl-CoA:carnitine CoA-transferase CaiB-like acyl-CoA transferase
LLLESLGATVTSQPSGGGSAVADWAESGAMAVTGPAEGPPALAPGAPASALAGALAAFDLLTRVRTGVVELDLPGTGLLGERAALAGLSRRAPRSVGGAFRALRAADGWLGLSLARPDDIALLPALTSTELIGDPWQALSAWLANRELGPVVDRGRLLGLPAASIPAGPVLARRAPVLCSPGGPREPSPPAAPLVVDLTSLWAGPLCAHLLGLAGARVVKVESRARPDGARAGTPAFFDLLHAGHLSVALDFGAPDDLAALRRLLARADVVLEASRPRALRQLGLDAEEYVAGGTIWASLTAYGRAGDDAQRIGYGDDVAAAAGLVAYCGDVPYPVGDAIADPLAGAHAAAAIAAALLSPRGQLLDISMYDVAVAAANPPPSAAAIDPAARAVPADPAEVIATGPGTWAVRTASGLAPVSPPRARQPRSVAAFLGRDTREVLAGP